MDFWNGVGGRSLNGNTRSKVKNQIGPASKFIWPFATTTQQTPGLDQALYLLGETVESQKAVNLAWLFVPKKTELGYGAWSKPTNSSVEVSRDYWNSSMKEALEDAGKEGGLFAGEEAGQAVPCRFMR